MQINQHVINYAIIAVLSCASVVMLVINIRSFISRKKAGVK